MARRPVVIVHGYSDEGKSASNWCRMLKEFGYDATTIHVSEYVSLSNEVTIKDIAEGFDRSLKIRAGLGNGEEFDAIVHSTGMLVIRAWLTTYGSRAARVKHLIGLAPATFGSPMAHKGRSFLGGIFKGSGRFGPDFMEAGDKVLSGLELGSAFTWDLADQDFITDKPVYGPDGTTPYPFIFIGLRDYGFVKRVATDPGTDGTVRWAGAGFNVSQDYRGDLTREADSTDSRVIFGAWSNAQVPLVLLANHNHGTIFGEPTEDLVRSVREALDVSTADEYADWRHKHNAITERSIAETGAHHWQQFVTHLVDERDDGISDYYVELYTRDDDGTFHEIEDFNLDFHPYREDPSYHCFHVDLDEVRVDRFPNLWLRLIASSGSKYVGYHGFGSERMTTDGVPKNDDGKWDAVIDLSSNLASAVVNGGRATNFFTPYTTTLVEMKMNREPMPLDSARPNQITWFLKELP